MVRETVCVQEFIVVVVSDHIVAAWTLNMDRVVTVIHRVSCPSMAMKEQRYPLLMPLGYTVGE